MTVQQKEESLSMIERVARAIVETPPEERQESTPDGWRIIRNFERTARAAIEAMREPTEGMQHVGLEFDYHNVESLWQAMINAALEEKP
ncbi:hypothetical protein B5M44_03930 [Shinella sumterensis]|uniref:hypothetical protein n=1 Tax=Shinella sumterensis TaxID=1967501 RepID=UPI00106EA2E4|nr:hypothetical protein [Shinella sumterensis]MCD1264107.1 hypothetical protein [Shinella sumterensis]TFE99363.1 hypothetical protein B5M44_03930 [Shinella sumterensis]